MKRNLILASLTLAATLSAGALAQNHPRSEVKQELRTDRHEQRDDRLDLQQLKGIQERFTAAQKQRRYQNRAVEAVDQQLRAYLSKELQESRVELAASNSEIKSSRGAWDSRSEVREARVEQRQEVRSFQRAREIQSKLERLYGRYDRASMSTRSQLIGELVALAKAEVRG